MSSDLSQPAPTSRVIAQSAAAGMSHTGDTLKKTVATVALPAGIMRANTTLRITTYFSAGANNANAKSGAVDIGGSTLGTAIITSLLGARSVTEVANRGAVNSQITYPSASPQTTLAPILSAIDFSAAQTITFAVQAGNAADTITLERYCVELLG